MSERFGFTEDEWDLVTDIPLEVYLVMLSVDVAVDSFDEEEVAFGKWLDRCAAQSPSGSWIHAAFATAARPTPAQAHGASSISEAELDAHLRELYAVLLTRVGEADAVAYSELLVKFANHVAAASAGPFPGGARITKAEGDLIWKIREVLGLRRTLHP